ncbi:hypothetical protein AZE42_12419 [Rhizopogon vesiculosus]|uniref:Uncharacterized protein n=1 Tax=Rhizopogon vesiculosus TaxID=180088 RepID=A0A1J8Q9T9_9AGAM|nr:hypothetical protein AZE42_12419 [Rhizopogon vesiculosus]
MSNANQAPLAISAISPSQLRSSKNQDEVSSSQPKSSGQPQQQPSSRASSLGKLASTSGAHPTVSGGTYPGDRRCDGTGGSSACVPGRSDMATPADDSSPSASPRATSPNGDLVLSRQTPIYFVNFLAGCTHTTR